MALFDITIKDGGLVSRVLRYFDAGSSKYIPASVIIDPTTGQEASLVTPTILQPRTSILNWTASTASLSSGHILADVEALTNVAPANDTPAILQSVTLLNKTFTAAAMRLHFFKANRSLGTEGANAISITDANALDHLGVVDIASGDWYSLVGSYVCTKSAIGLGIIPVTGTKDIYVGIEARGSITLGAATDIQGIFTFL